MGLLRCHVLQIWRESRRARESCEADVDEPEESGDEAERDHNGELSKEEVAAVKRKIAERCRS